VTSAGKPGNGSPKPDGASVQAALLSPEICIVVDIRITRLIGKADVFETSEGSSHVNANGELMRHHRGLRPAHMPLLGHLRKY